ncbi:MAG: flagellar hook capping FlgD N-terminal domain-containing protein [Candidatus Auribacterota bacterium]|jgi:flagellar basal-body rod modification protein FlgD|nr:flagellar hook capping FlgD N-terminal domain-containing protein [Candidatus Auribacterota bacterium]
MSVEEIFGAQGTSASDKSTLYSDANSNLGKEDFLMLLVAQLGNQDPLDPMDNQDFIAQMATFSQLEQMTNLNSSFDKFLQGQALAQYAPIIGKEVVAYDPDSESDISGIAESVSFDGSTPSLTINGKKVDIDNIKEIKATN